MRGHVRRHGKGWQAIVYAGRDAETGVKRYLRKSKPTKAEADEACIELLLQVGRGDHLAKDCTVAEMVDRWTRTLGPTWSPSRRAVVANHVRTKINAPVGDLPAIGGRLAKDVRPRDLDVLYLRLRSNGGRHGQGLARSTVETIHRIISAAYEEAIRSEVLRENPAARANLGPTEDVEVVAPDDEDVWAILDWLAEHDPDLLVYVTVSTDAGNRRGELLGARWSDLNVNRAELWLRHSVIDGGPEGVVERAQTKTGKSRRLTLSASTMETIAGHRRRMVERALACGVPLEADAYIFSDDPPCQRFWLPGTTTHRFIRARRAAGAADSIQLRHLRHYMASVLIAAGVDIATVSKRLGHSKISTTLDVYTHLIAAADQAAAGVMDEKLRGRRKRDVG